MLPKNSRYSKCKMKSKDFEDKVLSLSARIYPMVARMLGNNGSAEDAVQEIMIKLWDRRRGIGNHPNIQGYVFLTARNYCLDRLKKKNPDFESSDFQLKMLVSDISQNQVEWKELTTIIEKIKLTLRPLPFAMETFKNLF